MTLDSSTPPTAFSDSPAAAPDWEQFTHDVVCPLCGYNLRGLVSPQCPECGYCFDWPTVLDPAKRRHPYLFEHHPERNTWSFFQTLLHNLNSIRFWRTLDPVQQLRVSRLTEYWLAGTLAAFLPAIVGAVEAVIHRLQWSRPRPGRFVRYVVQTLNGTRTIRWAVVASLLLAVFPLLNFVALMIFQQSMHRRRIQAAHVLRCAIYSGDVILWYSLASSAAIVLCFNPRRMNELAWLLTAGALAAWIVNLVRLRTAYAVYLKFEHPMATVVASQIVVALEICTVLAYALLA